MCYAHCHKTYASHLMYTSDEQLSPVHFYRKLIVNTRKWVTLLSAVEASPTWLGVIRA